MRIFGKKICPEGHLLDPTWKACPVCIAPVRGWLVHLDGAAKAVKVHTLHEGKEKIGSGADCEVRILSTDIGRHHALIDFRKDECVISGLGSGKPIFVNGKEIPVSNLIDGDLVRLGNSEFKVKVL